jgi:RecA-family ATPase
MRIFPVKSNSKEPLITNWRQKASDDPKVIEDWKKIFPDCNWGISCEDYTIIDVDPPEGTNVIMNLDIKHGLPPTYIVKTPKGGYHYYFSGLTRNRVRMLPGIDIRSRGGYVLAPGSKTEKGVYTIYSDEPIASAPKWLTEMVGEYKEKEQVEDVKPTDAAVDLNRAEIFLRSCPPAIEGQGGDLHTYTVACRVRDMGISIGKCLELMLKYFNPRCKPIWADNALNRKILNAYSYANKALGEEAVVNLFEDETPKVDFLPISEYGHSSPPREWIAKGWIPKNATTLFTGDGSTGKSLAALQLAIAVATGSNWLNTIETTQMPVFIVTCEDDKAELDRRIFAIRNQSPFLNVDDAPLNIWTRAGKESLLSIENNGVVTKAKFFHELDAALSLSKKESEHGLLILDTLADLYGGNENIRSAVNGFLKYIIGGLTTKHNLSCIIIAHPSKQAGSTYAGNTAWHNGVRNRLFLQWLETNKKPVKNIRVLSHEKSNYSNQANEIMLEWIDGVLTPVQGKDIDAVIDRAVLDSITKAYMNGNSYSYSYQSPRYIAKISIKDAAGNPFSEDIIKQSVERLIANRMIENVKGQPRNNGLRPVEENEEPF